MKSPRFEVYVYGLVWGGKVRYIGVAKIIGRRLSQHRSAARKGSQLPVHRAFRAYGDPEIVILSKGCGYGEAYAQEANLVKQYRGLSHIRLLNVADGGRGGGGTRGKPLTEAHKLAISKANSGQGKGVPMPLETRLKISKTTRGRQGKKWTIQQREKVIAALSGKKRDSLGEATKLKLSCRLKLAWAAP